MVLQISQINWPKQIKANKPNKIQTTLNNHKLTLPHPIMTTKSKYPSQPLQKSRALYKQLQKQVNNNQLNRITQERMNKRYSYIAKQVQKKQQANDKENIEEMIFYRNKFHSLVVLVGESMRESYNKNKFETEVKNIIKDDWQGVNGNSSFSKNNTVVGNNPTTETKKQNTYRVTTSQYVNDPKPTTPRVVQKPQSKSPIPKQVSRAKNNNRSLSPLQQFFDSKQKEIQKSKHIMTFQSVIPKSQQTNSKLLNDIKQMNKKSMNGSTYRERTPQKIDHEDSRLRDLKRENQELLKILRKRQVDGGYKSDEQIRNVQDLQKQIHYYQKLNNELRLQANNQPIPHHTNGRNLSPYSITYRQNNMNQISHLNLQRQTSRRALQKLTDKSPQNKSQTYLGSNSLLLNDKKSNKTNTSSVVQKQKQLYINSTPQILFQNQLIKVLVIRFPLRIHQKNLTPSSQKLNPQDPTLNQQHLQIMILNNATKYVKNQQLLIKLDYDYDTKHHQIKNYKKSSSGYSKVAETAKDIVYREVVKVKLLTREGYNQEIKALIMAKFEYNFEEKRRRIFTDSFKNKKSDNFSIHIKLPVTFIQFSSKPFSTRTLPNHKTKLTIKPNPLYDTVQHAYMNTNLPFLKSSNPRVLKQHATLFGRSFVHDANGKGTYLQSQIDLSWFEKKDVKYISIETIEEWVYLLAYIFLDVEEEQQEFEKEFRKPSMHVFFNLENKQYV